MEISLFLRYSGPKKRDEIGKPALLIIFPAASNGSNRPQNSKEREFYQRDYPHTGF